MFGPGEMTARIRSTWFGAVCCLLGAIPVAGCGGGRPASSTVRSATTTAAQATRSPPRLSPAKAREVSRICRRAETAEDLNVVQEPANRGASLGSPAMMGALNRASRDVSHEAAPPVGGPRALA
jgi:hypothetical protein